MIPKNSEYRKLLTFFIVSAFFGSFSGAILPVHYLDSGVSLLQMSIARILPWVAQVFALILFTRLPAKKSLTIAIILSMLQVLLVIHIVTIWQFYLASIISGIQIHFFWTTYNTMHFNNTAEEDNGFSSGIMFTVFPVIAFITPFLSGLVVHYDIMYLWIISGILFFITLYMILPLKDDLITFKLRDSWKEIKSLRSILIIEGFVETTFSVLIPIYTLNFIHTPIGYGGFLSYLGLVGGIGNILFARFTDKIQSRSVFLYPVTLILALCTLLYPRIIDNFAGWLILAGLMSILTPFFGTLCMALMIDRKVNIMVAVPGRELALGIGRIIGCTCLVISFIYEPKPHYIFYLLGLGTLALPLVLWLKSKVLKQYNYL